MSWPCKPGERPIGRHDLVFVSPGGWRAMLATRGDLAADPLVARWSDRGWPTIRRRAVPGEASGVALGLPLPPSAGKKRLCLLLQSDDITSIARPPLLNDARASAPRAWWPALDRLDELGSCHSVEARVFGSLAWRALTGLDYLTDRSDLDLLLAVDRDTDLDRLVTNVAAIETDAPMRLDGELMREDGAAVNWREFHSGAGEVLVKDIEGIRLQDRELFISGRTRP
ncbi:malonate decarboxylase holo-[acyl-carrier-protein] synthase [Bradyrhizobium sp. CSA112]|uniref:malonate decarboxylase holo-[acyl-carrier-protein] synthase n=1 Tax=Bradyrhizobium sp. CSA112 TaxID=2699170 RepID=UPI0023B08A66|nr:malonate decarboxylase holo-[acyl-carrier-protein] synthase [Bradyrhizobium sp. CSA112]MDE5451781.1 malonate decarboxylase holo-[acyl-carrier-protein] synthase [Bradyrhizobium sp. CSA112]